MNELVLVRKQNKKEVPVTTSKIISQETERTHKSIQKIITKYEEDFLEFGKVVFQITPSEKNQPEKVYFLNESQFLLLITYMRNFKEKDKVRELKIKLIKEFERLRSVIQEKETLEWKETRQIGKIENRNMTDAIKKFVAYAESQGSKNFARYYSNFQKLANKSVGIGNGKRDLANHKRLFFLVAIMGIIEEKIYEGIQAGMFYKDIYKSCKGQIDKFEEFIPTTLRLNA